MFFGTFNHAIDAKGRTSVPARFRELIGPATDEAVPKLILTAGTERGLHVYPLAEWEAFESKLRALDPRQKGVREIFRTYVANATDVEVDKLGRILVPNGLRAWAQLERDVVWVGQLKHMELWSTANWARAAEDALSPEHQEDLERVFAELH